MKLQRSACNILGGDGFPEHASELRVRRRQKIGIEGGSRSRAHWQRETSDHSETQFTVTSARDVLAQRKLTTVSGTGLGRRDVTLS